MCVCVCMGGGGGGGGGGDEGNLRKQNLRFPFLYVHYVFKGFLF